MTGKRHAALWYAWGHIDAGNYPAEIDTDHGYAFRDWYNGRHEAYRRGECFTGPAMSTGWRSFVSAGRTDFSDTQGIQQVLKAHDEYLSAVVTVDLADENAPGDEALLAAQYLLKVAYGSGPVPFDELQVIQDDMARRALWQKVVEARHQVANSQLPSEYDPDPTED